MKTKLKSITVVFSALVGIFVTLISYFIIPFPYFIKQTLFPLIAILCLAFMALGIVLIVLTFRKKVKGKLKVFLLLTGFSSAGILPSAILHNAVYALSTYLGESFLIMNGSDEIFFFFMALIILPILFIIGAMGSIILLRKK